MKRLIIVYNPRSSHYLEVKEKVIEPSRKLPGWMILKFEVAQASVDENAKRLAKFLMDDDLVVSAGGDGTANMVLNSVLICEAKNVRMGVMGFGNFNDMARVFGSMTLREITEANTREIYPLECKVNGKHWRYAMCYFTLGMFAEACEVFDDPKTRKKLRKGKKHLLFSMFALAKWWLREHRRKFMPDFSLSLNDAELADMSGTSDYLAINSPTVAKMMRADRYFLKREVFLSSNGKLTHFWRMVNFMRKSVFGHIPSVESTGDKLVFNEPASVEIQAEGEYVRLEKVKEIEIAKVAKPLLAVVKNEG